MAYNKNIKHIYDNLNLTFKDIKEIFVSLSLEKIKLYEKFDGANVLIGYKNEMPVIARSLKDIKNGGLTKEQIKERFARKEVTEMFEEAYDAIYESFQKFGSEVKSLFENKWISAEIISNSHSNIVKYDTNNIIFHNVGFCEIEQKRVLETKVEEAFSLLNEVQVSTLFSNWNVSGPKVISLNKIHQDDILEFCHKLNMIKIAGRVGTNSTLKEYYQKWLVRKLKESMPNLYSSKANQISNYILKIKNPGLRNIKKELSSYQKENLNKFLLNSKNILREIKKPLEYLIHEFSNKLFLNSNSSLIENKDDEIKRQKEKVSYLFEKFKNTNNIKIKEEFMHQKEKLGSLTNITSPIEGITFVYNDDIIKLEGNYIVINRLKYLYDKEIYENNQSFKENNF